MECNEEEFLSISEIQHYMFCKRQWALIHIEDQWIENEHTITGHNNHERVHDSSVISVKNGVVTIRNLHVKSMMLGICGDCDAVEFIPSPDGVKLSGLEGTYIIRNVEYKSGNGHSFDADKMQAIAQAVCLEEMFCCEIQTVCVYYIKTKQKEEIQITQADRDLLRDIVSEMYVLQKRWYTPKVKPNNNCRACSLVDICLPQILKNTNVKKYIEDNLK